MRRTQGREKAGHFGSRGQLEPLELVRKLQRTVSMRSHKTMSKRRCVREQKGP